MSFSIDHLTQLTVRGALVAAFALAPASAFASEACLQSDFDSQVRGQGTTVNHPHLNGGSDVYAGTFKALIDGAGPFELYCVDISHYLCYPKCYQQAADMSQGQIPWILNNYYPAVPSEPHALSTTSARAAAVQLALWHFSDGLDISSGGSPSDVFAAARDIINAATSAPVAKTPTTLTVTPPSAIKGIGSVHTVTAKVLDQNGVAMSGVTVAFTVTGVNPGSGSSVTNGSGEAKFSYTGFHLGDDQITARVNYTIPVGLHWTSSGCQSLVMGQQANGSIASTATVTWQGVTATQSTTWGAIKATFLTR
jgi:TQXA domain-containing protein